MRSRFAACVAVIALFLSNMSIMAQSPVAVGKGSYAEFPPLSKGRTDGHWGDLSTRMQTMKLWVTEQPGRPIPTNDWWTGIINAPFGDALWSYPAMVHPAASGVTINYPSYWNENGTEVKWRSSIEVTSRGFSADKAIAHDWHDWDVEMLMPDASGSKSMLTTLMHGSPFTWIELTGIDALQVRCSDATSLFDLDGDLLDAADLNDYQAQAIGLKVGDDPYGIYLPAGCKLAYGDRTLKIDFAPGDNRYIVVALLQAPGYLGDYAEVAYNVPRNTTVTWNYNEKRGEISSKWSIMAYNLATGASGGNTVQGFLPHAYKGALAAPAFLSENYLTPRGTMKMCRGNEFTFTHKFAGMLPWYAHPSVDNDADHPYRPEVMEWLMRRYAESGSFGNDTYWGGKGLTQMALNMTFALQAGNTELFELSRDKLKAKLIDWLTYTPGEQSVYFAYYPRWGGLVGEDTSYDSDTFNDHHFHYGYYTLAGAILCMVDDDFRANYGDMLRLVAKDYANWDRNDTRFPLLRTLNPWVGHSYAGGLGDQGNSNGNGQESSSEAMQGWGGIYLLGVALGDKEMRDAGIFGWSTEARATREYWFDVDHVADRYGEGGNFDYTLYKSPYNTNITCKGIGWWTWFSGDPLHMHGIQWMPISTALDYMSWDRDFVEWAYNDLMNTPGWGHKWFEDGTNPDGGVLGMLANDDWGNVTLAYMQRALPRQAAAIFDEAYQRQLGIATAISTGHISYYTIHSHLTYGEIDWEINADIPTANAFVNDRGEYSYVVYNPDAEKVVTFYRNGTPVKSVKAPGRRFTTFTDAARPDAIIINSQLGKRFPASSQLTASVLDQYGASVDGAKVTWSSNATNIATVNAAGVVTFSNSVPDGVEVTITATSGNISSTFKIVKGAVPYVASATITPAPTHVEKGTAVDFSVEALDQYGEPFEGEATWSANGVAMDSPRFVGETPGAYNIEARVGGFVARHSLIVTPVLPNIARGKNVYSSSEENVGTLTANANDGATNTRWGSLHRDGEWIYVDLGVDCKLTRVDVNWEAAFASSYLIQAAPDGARTAPFTGEYVDGKRQIMAVAEDQWTTIAEVTGVNGAGVMSTVVDATGRYVRIKGTKRATAYGISILELEVSGIPVTTGPGDVVGIEISSDRDYIDEDKTATFAARLYCLDGSEKNANVNWSATGGTITPQGVFTPSTFGTAIISASTTDGALTSSKSLAVNEVIKLESLSITPSELKIAVGNKMNYDIEGIDQFGGLYTLPADMAVTITDAAGNPSTGITVANGTVTAHAAGNYSVTFTVAGKSATMTVDVVAMNDINLALGRPTLSGSGVNASLATDGNAETRWQADPTGDQWLQVELDDIYYVNKFTTIWENACASLYHIETSIDGETWCEVAANDEPMTAAGSQTITCPDVPARFVRIVGDKFTPLAAQWGMSLFEFEVYGSGIVSTADNEAPVITRSDINVGVDALNITLSATDNSGIIFFTVIATENSAVAPSTVTRTVMGHSGEEVTMTLANLNPSTGYTIDLVATDVAGNRDSRRQHVTTGTTSIVGDNLALGKPVEVSSVENAGLAGKNAVDGNLATRWGSQFNDGEWIKVDLGAVYRVQQIKVTTNDAAYASVARWECSIDGEVWTTLGDRTMNAIGTDLMNVDNVAMRYFRYTGVKRATGYGTSVAEIEVYGDALMLGVAAAYGTDLKLEGAWDATIFNSIDDETVTSYDLTAVTGLPATITPRNPNCLLYVTAGTMTGTNVVALDPEGKASATDITLYQGHDFNAVTDIAVKGNFSLILASRAKAHAVVLPIDFTPDADRGIQAHVAYRIDGSNLLCYASETIAAHRGMILRNDTPFDRIDVAGATLKAVKGSRASDLLSTSYRNIAADGYHRFDAPTDRFIPAQAGTVMPSFSSFIAADDDTPLTIRLIESPTDIEELLLIDDAGVDVYTTTGVLLRRNAPASAATRGLAPGVYVEGGRKVLVK